MARNLELKCRYPNHRLAESVALDTLRARYQGRLLQTDTYFNFPPGRLKLREERFECPDGVSEATHAELIHYSRRDEQTAKVSTYQRLPVNDRRRVRAFFSRALGILVRVHKARRLFLKDNVRIHVDTVRGVGRFLEFEVIVSSGRPLQTCRKQMSRLFEAFQIDPASLVPGSYSDLLLLKQRKT
jgi:adenylate cyclase, class 2